MQKLKSGGLSKLFGAWNRRFLFLNLEQKNLYYSSSPTSESQTLIKLSVASREQSVRDVKILGNNIEEKTVLLGTADKDYTFKFENLAEFRDFLIYFIFVKKVANGQKLFDPPEPVPLPHQFLDLIRQSQLLSEQNRKLLKAGLPPTHLRDDVRPLDPPGPPPRPPLDPQPPAELPDRDLERRKKQEQLKNCPTDDEDEPQEKKKKKKKPADQPQPPAPPEEPAPLPAKPQERAQRLLVRRDLADPDPDPAPKLALKKPAAGLPAKPLRASLAEKPREAPRLQAQGLREEDPPSPGSPSRPSRAAQPRADPSPESKPGQAPGAAKPRSKFVDDSIDIDFSSSVRADKLPDPRPDPDAPQPAAPSLSGSLANSSALGASGPRPRLLIQPKVLFGSNQVPKQAAPRDKQPAPEARAKEVEAKPRPKPKPRDEDGDWQMGPEQQQAPRGPARLASDEFDFDS